MFSWFCESNMPLKLPAFLHPVTFHLTFFANLLPQVIVLNAGMKSWTVRPCFFIMFSLYFEHCTKRCRDLLCSHFVSFLYFSSFSLKGASWHAAGEVKEKMLYCLKKMNLLNELFLFFDPLSKGYFSGQRQCYAEIPIQAN